MPRGKTDADERSSSEATRREWESIEKAKAFLESEELRELNRGSGLIEMGELRYLVEVDKGTLD
jgi:hypothetical protein